MSGTPEDGSPRGRGVVRPPPVSGGVSDVDVPRLEPPPPSLEAMMQSAPRKSRGRAPRRAFWPVLAALALLAALVAAYISR